MGHERVGALPKTRPWQKVVKDIAAYNGGAEQSRRIANETLENVRHRFESIQRDPNVRAAFKFLTEVAVAGAGRALRSGCRRTRRLSTLLGLSTAHYRSIVAHRNMQPLPVLRRPTRSQTGMRKTRPSLLCSVLLKRIPRSGKKLVLRAAFVKLRAFSSRSSQSDTSIIFSSVKLPLFHLQLNGATCSNSKLENM